MQALFRRKGFFNLHNLALKLALGQHGKHSSAKLQRAKFDNNESYKTFKRRHNRRKHNEFLKQQATRGWDDTWESSRKSSKKEAAGIHVISDEMLFQWMFQDATSSKADKRQLKALKQWVKQFEQATAEPESSRFTYQRATNDKQASQSPKAEKRQQQTWADWQKWTFTSHMGTHSFEDDYEGWYYTDSNSRTNQQQARDGRQQQKAQQQSHHDSFAQQSSQMHQCMRVLGVSVLEPALLKQAFLECAKKWHPDRHADDAKAAAETKFKEAQTAYQYLQTCV